MYRILLFILFNIILYSCGKKDSGQTTVIPPPIDTQPVTPKPYQLVWSDEFDKDGPPDSTKWGYDLGGGGYGNNELENYTNRPQNVRDSSGYLVIEARKEDYMGNLYTSARLLTKNKAQWTYGKFEIRAKLPRGVGTWPAIWLLSATDPLVWPDDGELDIMEEVGFNPNVIYGTAHNKMYNGANGTQKGGNMNVPTAQDSFHVYTLEWTTNTVKWSVDSISYFMYQDPGQGPNAWPYYKDFFMILNIAVGGNWGGSQGVDDTIFPQEMLVDYVRVYQRK